MPKLRVVNVGTGLAKPNTSVKGSALVLLIEPCFKFGSFETIDFLRVCREQCEDFWGRLYLFAFF